VTLCRGVGGSRRFEGTWRWNIQGSRHSSHVASPFTLEDEGATFFRNIENVLPSDTASHFRHMNPQLNRRIHFKYRHLWRQPKNLSVDILSYISCWLSIWRYYIYKVSVILHDNLQRESHKPYAPPTWVTWSQLLRKRTNTGTTARSESARRSTRTLPTCGVSVGSLTLPVHEAGDFLELILLYKLRRFDVSQLTGRYGKI
jgi:hypothetical protein